MCSVNLHVNKNWPIGNWKNDFKVWMEAAKQHRSFSISEMRIENWYLCFFNKASVWPLRRLKGNRPLLHSLGLYSFFINIYTNNIGNPCISNIHASGSEEHHTCHIWLKDEQQQRYSIKNVQMQILLDHKDTKGPLKCDVCTWGRKTDRFV